MNAFVAFTVVAKNGIEWENALGMTFIAGVLYFLVVVSSQDSKILFSLTFSFLDFERK